ncbi:MAG: 3-hydroxyacyl-ACP dehydratase FabZ [Pseudomonadota bacterium]
MTDTTTDLTTLEPPFDVNQVMQMIPHRFPLLMLDRIVELKDSEYAVGLKNFTINEHFFVGHFPQRPVVPGVLLIEAMAQTAAVFVVRSLSNESAGKVVYLMSVDKVRFRSPVVPGDQAFIHVDLQQARRNVFKFQGHIKVDDKICAQAEFAAMVMDS